MEREKEPKRLHANVGHAARTAALLLAVATAVIFAAYIYFIGVVDDYAELALVGTPSEGYARQYRQAKANARLVGALLAGGLLAGHALVVAVLLRDRRRLDAEHARTLEEKLLLEVSEERYRLIERDSEAVILEVNYIEKTIVANEMFEKLIGDKPRYEYFLNGRRVHPEDRQAYFELLAEVYEKRRSSTRELRMLDCEGNYVWFSVLLSGLAGADGKIARVIGKYANIDEQKRRMELLELQAQTDPMTGLYNRAVTEEIIARLLNDEADSVHALLILDIDDLKSINDTCGHAEGDQAIREITAALRGHFRAGDVTGRIGGDEFIVFLRNIGGEDQLCAKIASLIARLDELRVGECGNCAVRASIGAALTRPGAREDFTRLYREADTALYRVKRCGKNEYAIYSEEMGLIK